MNRDPQGLGHDIQIQLVAKHEQAGLYLMTELVSINIGDFVNQHKLYGYLKDIIFEVICISPRITNRIIPTIGIANFLPIDATPQLVEIGKEFNLTDISVFKSINVGNDFEIYLSKKDEIEIMEFLIKKQDKKQKEIRKNRRHAAWKNNINNDISDGYNPSLDIVAQLIVINS